jgi:hypothetical protein
MLYYNLKWQCNSFAAKMVLMLVLVVLKHISLSIPCILHVWIEVIMLCVSLTQCTSLEQYRFLYFCILSMLIVVIWVMPCSLVSGYQHFGRLYHHLKGTVSSEMLIIAYRTTWCHNSEDYNQLLHCCDNLKSQMFYSRWC